MHFLDTVVYKGNRFKETGILDKRLILSFFFKNKKSRSIDQKFRPKSNFNPPGPINPVLKLELDHLERSLGSLELKKHRII